MNVGMLEEHATRSLTLTLHELAVRLFVKECQCLFRLGPTADLLNVSCL